MSGLGAIGGSTQSAVNAVNAAFARLGGIAHQIDRKSVV